MNRDELLRAKRLFDAAYRDWEFHDASCAFHSFAAWVEMNFTELLKSAGLGRSCSCGHPCGNPFDYPQSTWNTGSLSP
jgi:hypothetical protein